MLCIEYVVLRMQHVVLFIGIAETSWLLLQYAEFIAALQPQMTDDTSPVARHTTGIIGAMQPEDASEPSDPPTQLLMQPQPGEVPGAQQQAVGFRNSVHIQDASANKVAQAVDSLDGRAATLQDSITNVESL